MTASTALAKCHPTHQTVPQFVRGLGAGVEHRRPCPQCKRRGKDDAFAIKVDDDGRGGTFYCHRCAYSGNWREPINGAKCPALPIRHTCEPEDHLALWESGTEPSAAYDHPYLIAKQIGTHGVRVKDDMLLVPLRNIAGELVGVQKIDGSGTKLFTKGARTVGAFHLIGTPDGKIVIVEGYATGASVFEGSGECVAVAFNCANVLPVAKSLRKKYPAIEIIVGADDDHRTPGNPGLTAATAAAHAVGALLAVPDFGADRAQDLTDFNDLLRHRGPEAVRTCIATAKRPHDDADTHASPQLDVALDQFYAYMPAHQYLFIPTRELWPATSVNGRIVDWPEAQKGKRIRPSNWLDANRPVEQMIWHPGEPEIIRNQVLQSAGWVKHHGTSVFNLYRPPLSIVGDATKAGPWIEHVRKVYPGDTDHLIAWLAHRIQRPGEKVNHAIVLGGMQGIGKDTLLEPVKAGIGPWNWQELNPTQMLGRFNGWAKAVVVRVSEARDLGEVDRYGFYDHSKVYIAAPPDVLRVDEKHLREHYVANVCGVVITTNHASDGLYLPADDRRHYVAWSSLTRNDFPADYWPALWEWYNRGGIGHVVAYLHQLDITGTDWKAPPVQTAAFWNVVASGEAPESGELRDVLDAMGNPEAFTLEALIEKARSLSMSDLADEMVDRRQRRAIPHQMERVGYVPVRNPNATDGLFKLHGRRQVVYALRSLPPQEQVRVARRLVVSE